MADEITVSLAQDTEAWQDISPRAFATIGRMWMAERQRRVDELNGITASPQGDDDDDAAEAKRGRGAPTKAEREAKARKLADEAAIKAAQNGGKSAQIAHEFGISSSAQ